MWTILQAAGLNKWIAYGIAAIVIFGTVTTVVLRIRAGGAQSERLKQVSESLSTMKREALERARIEAISTAAARQRLRDRWSNR